jgi:hypothetical protein
MDELPPVALRRNTLWFPAVPFRPLIEVAVVLGTKPLCIQWRRVLVAGGLLVGMSRSIMITVKDVPVNLLTVPS